MTLRRIVKETYCYKRESVVNPISDAKKSGLTPFFYFYGDRDIKDYVRVVKQELERDVGNSVIGQNTFIEIPSLLGSRIVGWETFCLSHDRGIAVVDKAGCRFEYLEGTSGDDLNIIRGGLMRAGFERVAT